MSDVDTTFNLDRYRRLLAEADSEAKRLAFIELLIEEKARDRLTQYLLRSRMSGLGSRVAAPPPGALPSAGEKTLR